VDDSVEDSASTGGSGHRNFMNDTLYNPQPSVKIVVPWHSEIQLQKFLSAWRTSVDDKRFIFKQDKEKQGCARTKNAGIKDAIEQKMEVVIILDDDCFPEAGQESFVFDAVDLFIQGHLEALQPVEMELFKTVTNPPSRGTPYYSRSVKLPVAASMGFWTEVGDYDAVHQLAFGATHPMEFDRAAVFGQYFPLCGMNLAFKPADWWPWCEFIDVPRFDDIWQGFLWQKKAYAEGYCFNLNGPLVRHSRQSNVWANLEDETKNLKRNESIWQKIATSRELDYEELKKRVLTYG
jgi:hypothetical protein